LKPSHADIELTQKMRSAGKLLDIPVLDHLIISDQGFLSFADEGILD
jgi:DNA repair protein RadC